MSERAETGAMRFEGDWRGVFIRGDNAFGYAMYLKAVLANPEHDKTIRMYKTGLEGLMELLLSSDERQDGVETQQMKPFDDCVVDTSTVEGR